MHDVNLQSEKISAAQFTGLVRRALQKWDIDANSELHILGLRENAVFKVATPAGKKYALRVHRPGYHRPTEVESELIWTASLTDSGIFSPGAVAAKDGSFVQIVGQDGEPGGYAVTVLEWFDGAPPSEDAVVENYRMLGELNARIHNHSACWSPPAKFKRQSWDEDGLLGTAPIWGHFANLADLADLTNGEADLLRTAQSTVRGHMMAYGKSKDRFGLIHADLMPENILVNGDDVRVIDFDDGGFGWYMYDPATAFFMHVDEGHYLDMRQAWLEGYQTVRTLTAEDIDAIDALLVARGLIALGWAHTRPCVLDRATLEWLADVTCRLARSYLEDRS